MRLKGVCGTAVQGRALLGHCLHGDGSWANSRLVNKWQNTTSDHGTILGVAGLYCVHFGYFQTLIGFPQPAVSTLSIWVAQPVYRLPLATGRLTPVGWLVTYELLAYLHRYSQDSPLWLPSHRWRSRAPLSPAQTPSAASLVSAAKGRF